MIGTNEVYLPQSEASRVPKRGKLSKVYTDSWEPLAVTISYIVIIVIVIIISTYTNNLV